MRAWLAIPITRPSCYSVASMPVATPGSGTGRIGYFSIRRSRPRHVRGRPWRTTLNCTEFLLFGGLRNGKALADTWLWDGSSWLELSPISSPPARFGASLGYEPVSDSMLLFGGATTGCSGLRDTWSWQGSHWRRLTPAQHPPALCGGVLVFDETQRSLVLVGGWPIEMGMLARASMWLWNGSTWRHATPPAQLGARAFAAVAPHPSSGLTCFGGVSYGQFLNDTTRISGASGQAVSSSSPPSPRGYAAAAVDPTHGGMLLFGGQGEAGPLGDTWILG